jgi:hypothetical protein
MWITCLAPVLFKYYYLFGWSLVISHVTCWFNLVANSQSPYSDIILSSVHHSSLLSCCLLHVFLKSRFAMAVCSMPSDMYISDSNPTHLHVIFKSAVFAAVSLRHFLTACGLWVLFVCFLLLIYLPVSFNNPVEVVCYPSGLIVVGDKF